MKKLYNRNRGYLFAVLDAAIAVFLFYIALTADSRVWGAIDLFAGVAFTTLVPVWVSLQLKENERVRRRKAPDLNAFIELMRKSMESSPKTFTG